MTSLDGTSNNPDLIVIATKAQHVLEAVVSAHRVIQDAEPHCALLLIQNGIGTTRFAVPIPLTPNKFYEQKDQVLDTQIHCLDRQFQIVLNDLLSASTH